jgi:FAD:protein FMN transferase
MGMENKTNNKSNRSCACLLIVFMILATAACVQKDVPYAQLTGFTQGTSYNIMYQCKKFNNHSEAIDQILLDVDRSMSIYNPESTLFAINQNKGNIKAEEKLLHCLSLSKEIYENTQGAFDVTVGPLINAWGFGKDSLPVSVEKKTIDSLMQFVGFDQITIENKQIRKAHPSVSIDLNGIAKGYTVDLVADFLESKNIQNYLVEIGGEIRTRGMNSRGIPWRIGVDKPEDGHHAPGSKLQAILNISGKAMATSGNYRRYYEKDGKKYAHTIDPRTGYPVQHNLLSATVITERCAIADAYATACMVIGVKKSIALLENDTLLSGYLVWSDEEGNYQSYLSPSLQDQIETIDD